MRVLIYKRAHPFDPNEDGVFGCQDCMGAVRARRFDAVIGVGGISANLDGTQSTGVSIGSAWEHMQVRASP